MLWIEALHGYNAWLAGIYQCRLQGRACLSLSSHCLTLTRASRRRRSKRLVISNTICDSIIPFIPSLEGSTHYGLLLKEASDLTKGCIKCT